MTKAPLVYLYEGLEAKLPSVFIKSPLSSCHTAIFLPVEELSHSQIWTARLFFFQMLRT